MNAEKKQNSQISAFWIGLIIGVVVTGILVLLLDKEEKNNLKENLKKGWEGILAKLKEVIGEKETMEGLKTEEVGEPNTQSKNFPIKKEDSKPVKKFFKRAGKILH